MSETPPDATSEAAVTEGSDGGDSLLRAVIGVGRRTAPTVLLPGQLIADTYRILRKLGAGGMGTVYLARDQRLGRDVAIKLHTAAASGRGSARLVREASAIAQLTHDHVVTVYQIDSHDGQPFVAMEYVDGGTARSWLASAPRTWREILAVYLGAGRGLAAAHRLGLVHRDFKPDNVLIGTDGRVRVADFGLVQGNVPSSSGDSGDGDGAADGDGCEVAAPAVAAPLTRTGAVLGTPAYMAPEQRAGGVVGAAADQFAFAVSLWEALTGARPFRGDTEETLRAAVVGPIETPARAIPRHLDVALRRALALAPEDRWPAMEPLLAALARDPARARRRIAAGVGIGALVLAAGVAVVWRAQAAGETPPDPCARAAGELATAAKLRAALTGPAGDLGLAKLDAWMAGWRSARLAACEDTHVRRIQPVAVLELRELCLDRARTSLEVTLGEMSRSKDRDGLLDALPLLADCADRESLAAAAPLPEDPAARAEIEAVSAGIAEVEVMRAAGRYPESLAACTALLARAEATGRKALIAEVLLALGPAQSNAGKLAGVVDLYERAAKLAAEDGADRIAASAWLAVLDAFVARLEQPADALRMLPVAEAAVLRAGNTERLRAGLLGSVGDLEMMKGDLPAARRHYEEAIALHERVFGENAELARKLNRLASLAMRLEDRDTARAHLHRAADILERNYGPRYRHLAVIWTTLGGVEYNSGNLAEARKVLERALALKEETNEPEALALVTTLTDLATVLTDIPDLEPAERHIRRALAIVRRELGPDHAKAVYAMRSLARIQMARQDAKGAEATLVEAIAIQRRLANLPPLDNMELDLARLLVDEGRFVDARAAVDRAKRVPIPNAETSSTAVKILELTGIIELAAGNRTAGRAALQRAVAILRERYGDQQTDVVRMQTMLDASR